MQNHVYVSRVMLTGMYINRFYPSKLINYKNQQQQIKRQIGKFFVILKNLGIVEQFNTTVVRVDQEKLKEFGLDDILSYAIKDSKN